MKYQEALRIIREGLNPGYMVSLERVEANMLCVDYFPDQAAGEELIPTEHEAWKLAKAFAKKTHGKYVHIYVVKSNYIPVPDYRQLMIENR